MPLRAYLVLRLWWLAARVGAAEVSAAGGLVPWNGGERWQSASAPVGMYTRNAHTAGTVPQGKIPG